jgi:nicotinamide mononucleotide (NMN) deamidase PncC
MSPSVEQLVERMHASPCALVLAIAGGGSRAIADLLEVPGASRLLLEAVVPYAEEALIAWLGGRPDQACAPQTARAMAVVAFRRAVAYMAGGGAGSAAAEQPAGHVAANGAGPLPPPEAAPAGVACAAALATDRPRRGPHRAHVALQTASRTVTWSLELQKGRRGRAEEERLVGRLLLNAVAAACAIDARFHMDLLEGEHVEQAETIAPQPWQDLLLGKVDSVCRGSATARAILSGAFHPLHAGHRRIAEIARQVLNVPVALEISIETVDKPPLDFSEIERRLAQFPPEQPVWLTRAATFEEKSRLFPGATFLVGVDTLRRIAAPGYYGHDSAACRAAIERIAARGCRFLVFGRDMGTGFVRMSDLELPETLGSLCREVPPELFREDVSSTEIRKSEAW